MRERILDDVLGKKLKGGSDADRALVRRVLVGEMASREISLTGDESKDEKAISEMVNEVIDGDESLKKTVSEMENTPPAPPQSGGGNSGGSQEWKPGMSTSTVRVKARS